VRGCSSARAGKITRTFPRRHRDVPGSSLGGGT